MDKQREEDFSAAFGTNTRTVFLIVTNVRNGLQIARVAFS